MNRVVITIAVVPGPHVSPVILVLWCHKRALSPQ